MNPTAEGRRQILLVEDDPNHAILISRSLDRLGGKVCHAPTCAAARAAVAEERFDLILLDARMPDGDGFELHRWIRRRGGSPPVIFVTGESVIDRVVEAMRAGAVHYVVKRPGYLGRLRELVTETLGRSPGLRQAAATTLAGSDGLIGGSEGMQRVRDRVQTFARSDAPVLVLGETGTGKELVARAVHRSSGRSSGPFVAVNCASISPSLFESEVFGSVRGAFTGALRDREGLVGAARGGTLFLDEVGEMPHELQPKLLRLLEDGQYRPVGSSRELRADLRVVAATHRDLRTAVASHTFRADLFYRLASLCIEIPALRDRVEDIGALVRHFLIHIPGAPRGLRVDPLALAELCASPWPGNVRELRSTIERTLLLGAEDPIRHFDLPAASAAQEPRQGSALTRDRLAGLLARHAGRLGAVAAELGVSIRTVQRRLKDLGLRLRDFRPRSG